MCCQGLNRGKHLEWLPACRTAHHTLTAHTRAWRYGIAITSSRGGRQSFSHGPCFKGIKAAGHPHARPVLPFRTAGASGATAAPAAADPRARQLSAPVVIIGGGPAGLCTALMLAQRGYTNIKVRTGNGAWHAATCTIAPSCSGPALLLRLWCLCPHGMVM